jgi:hypothetical protein
MEKTKFTLGKFSFPIFFLQPTVPNYSIAVITFYLLRPHKLTNENQSQIQSIIFYHICHVKNLRLEFFCQVHNYCFRF